MICTFELGPLDGQTREIEDHERGFHVAVCRHPRFDALKELPMFSAISYDLVAPNRMILRENSFETLCAIGYFAGEKYEKMRAWDPWN